MKNFYSKPCCQRVVVEGKISLYSPILLVRRRTLRHIVLDLMHCNRHHRVRHERGACRISREPRLQWIIRAPAASAAPVVALGPTPDCRFDHFFFYFISVYPRIFWLTLHFVFWQIAGWKRNSEESLVRCWEKYTLSAEKKNKISLIANYYDHLGETAYLEI